MTLFFGELFDIKLILLSLFFGLKNEFIVVDPDRVFIKNSTDFLLRSSEAFVTLTSKPNYLAIRTADEVLPIPGGPETKHALQLIL